MTLNELLERVTAYQPGADTDLIKKAYVFAATSHEGQTRRSGEPYIMHPLAVAGLITELKLDVPSICAALLHDTVEDTPATYEEIEVLFSKEIADLVDGVTKLGKLRFRNKAERQAESFRKMLVAMSKDIRVILVKLADRLHNMRTLGHVPPEKAAGIARETRDIFAPLANRLGIQWVKCELEDLSFRYIEPDSYQHIRTKVNEKRSEREEYISEVLGTLNGLCDEQGISADITGRPKHFYSIHRKMKAQQIDYEQVYDSIAFRIIVKDISTCYQALGMIHSRWRPIPGRFKDYVALPKPNRYQSLHTAVLGPQNRRMEVQIRTDEMHRVAENGIAAHWKYKEGQPVSADDEQKFAWLRQLLEWQREFDDPTDFFDMVKLDLFSAEIYVFTPKGDLKVLPKGSTPVDFAYTIHSEVGEHCAGAKVNNVMVGLDHQLRSGDTCSIITRSDQKPSMDWLKFVRTARAKSRIRQVYRQEQRQRGENVGREALDKALRKYKRTLKKEITSGRLEEIATGPLKQNSLTDLLVLVGYGKIRPESVIEHLVPNDDLQRFKDREEGRIEKLFRKVVSGGKPGGIKVDGLDDVVVRFSRCCNPVPGDEVTGFITRGRGVAVHTRDCRRIQDADPDRRIDVHWDGNARAARPIELVVISNNSPGLLASISSSLSEHGLNITEANCRTDRFRAVNTFGVLVESAGQLRDVIRSISRISGVHSVERVRN